MYNLSVAVAQTYYVGEGQWLVHNCETVAFGLQARGLQNFANQQGAKTFADLGLKPTSETFMADLVKSMTDAKQIKFNVSGMDNIGELIRNPQFGVAGGSTNWELQVVSFNPEFRAKTTFHYGDKTYTYEQLLEAFPWKK